MALAICVASFFKIELVVRMSFLQGGIGDSTTRLYSTLNTEKKQRKRTLVSCVSKRLIMAVYCGCLSSLSLSNNPCKHTCTSCVKSLIRVFIQNFKALTT